MTGIYGALDGVGHGGRRWFLRSHGRWFTVSGADILPGCDRQNVFGVVGVRESNTGGLRLEQERSWSASGQSFVQSYQGEIGRLCEGGEVVICPAIG